MRKDQQSNPEAEEVTTLHTYSPITEWRTPFVKGAVHARIVERRGRKYLDLREYHESEKFSGFTKRGLRFSAAEIRILEDIIKDAKTRLIPTAPGVKDSSWQESSNATGARTPEQSSI